MENNDDPVDLDEVMRQLDYLADGNQITASSIRVCGELQVWLDRYGDQQPLASVSITGESVEIKIGDVSVWSTEDDGNNGPSFADCLLVYRVHLDELMEPFDVEQRDGDEDSEWPIF
jgi:hypothetical protein